MERTRWVWAFVGAVVLTAKSTDASSRSFPATPFVAVHLAGLPSPAVVETTRPVVVTVPARAGRAEERLRVRYGWHHCGFGNLAGTFDEEPLADRPDPVALIATGYRTCARVRVTVIAGYGATAETELDHFLVNTAVAAGGGARQEAEFEDEDQIGRYFRVACRLPAAPEREWGWYGATPASAPEYRQGTSFQPEVVLDFGGEKPVTLEINFTSRRVFLQTADEWCAYNLDEVGALLVRALLAEGASAGSEPQGEKL